MRIVIKTLGKQYNNLAVYYGVFVDSEERERDSTSQLATVVIKAS